MKYHESLPNKLNRLNIKNILYNDIDCWNYYKKEKQIYNKLWLAEIQGIECGPIGTIPNKYPIVIKPIINLYGMSRSFKICYNIDEYMNYQKDGCFWTPYFSGYNYNYDIIFDKGKIIFYTVLISKPSVNGTFDYHVYSPDEEMSYNITLLLETYFNEYSGPMNIEVISNNIIEGHLRLNGDSYIYNDEFFINLSRLIDKKSYNLNVSKKIIYLFPYFVNSYFDLKFLDKKEVEEILFKKNCNLVYWDNIKSNYQRDDLCRLLMYITNNYNDGINIRKEINNNLIIREKIYPYINNGL
jgi:hypothetical protein